MDKTKKFFKRTGGAIKDSGKITTYKTKQTSHGSNIRELKAQFGIMLFDQMEEGGWDAAIAKVTYDDCKAKTDKYAIKIADLQEQIDSLTFGKQEEAKEEGGEEKGEEKGGDGEKAV